MTGYGAGRARLRGGTLDVELRSVNGRLCDIRCNFARELLPLEADVRELVKTRVARGQVTVFARLTPGAAGRAAIIDEAQARRAIATLKKIAKSVGIASEGNLDTLLRLQMLAEPAEPTVAVDELRAPVMKAVRQALRQLVGTRAKEGAALARDLRQRGRSVEREANAIGKQAPEVVKRYQARIRQRLESLQAECGVEFDPVRVLTEVGIFSERVDITEEVTRLRSHLDQFKVALNQGGRIGKRIDFILQEMFREANTIGNKCGSAAIATRVVAIKEELEKMREQAQNIE